MTGQTNMNNVPPGYTAPTANDSVRGLYQKYVVSKLDGTPSDPSADYLVLRIDNDYAAMKAAIVYADEIAVENPQFSQELKSHALTQLAALEHKTLPAEEYKPVNPILPVQPTGYSSQWMIVLASLFIGWLISNGLAFFAIR